MAALHRLLTATRRAAGTVAGSLLTLALIFRPHRKASERARQNAERLITACRDFQARHGRLPDSLEELVPGFLPALPPAKYDGPHFGFTYDTSEDRTRHVLGWTEVIPFGRPYYVFEEDRWGYLD
jgi:hypothetical protein